jgi:anti-sigma B factor antagonist
MDYDYEGFEIETRRPAPNVRVLAVRGEVDVYTSLGLMDSVIEVYRERPEVIALDLTDLRFMDSAGLQVLLQSARHIEEGGVRFAVVLPSDHPLARQPHLTGLHRRINVHESAEDALGPWLEEGGEPTAQ